jgi:class 3 adenylate cyclase
MDELLAAETLSLGGARRQVTVLFADVRGFTELTDTSQERVEEFIRENNFTGAAAEACRDKQARETLEIVNTYLGLVAETILKHDATLDKFIGDCVMAFWGAPTPNPQHALCCVRAAIAAQRAIYQLNLERAEENRRSEIENQARQSAGLPVKPPLPTLLLGSGINTGMVTVGLMGSQARTEATETQETGWRQLIRAARNFLAWRFGKRAPSPALAPSPSPEQQNYTVFGREVNLASRLESASGRGRIFIGETTYQHLQRDDPALAATCVLLDAQKLKGFSRAITAYEVPWRPADSSPASEELSAAKATQGTSLTHLVQRA